MMNIYKCYRFPPDIISYAVWLYYRLNLSFRDIEDLYLQNEALLSVTKPSDSGQLSLEFNTLADSNGSIEDMAIRSLSMRSM